MAAQLFCVKCGLPAALDEVGPFAPCVVCGNSIYVPMEWLEWEVALTEDDKKFLRVNRIAIT